MSAPQEDVIAEIVSVVRSLGDVSPELCDSIGRDTNIVRDLKLDSIAVMDFIMEQTVGDLAEILARNHAQV